MNTFTMKRLGLVIDPEPGNANEAGGILNPAATRGPDGELYLFPRLVAAGNYSRVGIARVEFNRHGDPTGIERLGIALEPEAPYELRPNGEGGCEDPRVTYVEPLESYIMTYTAFSPEGPRIALAKSKDLIKWERLGLATFQPYEGIHFDGIDNKDACMFPVAIPNPTHHKELAILHRPLFPGTSPEENLAKDGTRNIDLHRESIWISYSPEGPDEQPYQLRQFTSHDRLAAPVSPWESLKIGSGCPPIMCKHGWLFIYHGVADVQQANGAHQITYSAGVMVLSAEHPQELLYRTTHPALEPEPSTGPRGTPSDVVFPSGVDRRDDIGQPERFDVYFGMNDFRIGVARLDVPDVLPHPGVADPVTATAG
ncbi:MAG: glycosidase [Acidimicrobiales bacterium]